MRVCDPTPHTRNIDRPYTHLGQPYLEPNLLPSFTNVCTIILSLFVFVKDHHTLGSLFLLEMNLECL